MKKIVILVDQLNSHGGIEKLVSVKANYWAINFGYDVSIISTEQDNKPIVYTISDKVNIHDLKINYIRTKSYFSFQNLVKFIKNIVILQSYIFKTKPDFILVASHIPITYVAPFFITKAKTIKEFHFTKFNNSNIGFTNKMITFIESKYNYLAVLSAEEQSYYFSKNTIVIPNPVEIAPNFENIESAKKQNIAVSILRFAPVKRLEILISIWKKFHHQNKSWKLHIFGTKGNDYFNKINQLVIDKNLQETIIFKGQTNNVESELKNSKVLLLTSEQECFPMVILEANACGVPVISFDCPTGPRNMITNNKDGYLVENNNINQFVEKLQLIEKDPKMLNNLSQNAIENAKKYAIENIMNQWKLKIFEA